MKTFASLLVFSTLLFAVTDVISSKDVVVPMQESITATNTVKEEVVAEVAEPINEEVSESGNAKPTEYVIQNSPYLKKSTTITITATGVGVVPSSTISAAQGIALANRAAIVDAYRQMGEKMHGVHLTAEDTIKNMVIQSTHVRAKVASIVKNANVIDSTFHNGLYQVTMQVKLDGKVWHNYLEQM